MDQLGQQHVDSPFIDHSYAFDCLNLLKKETCMILCLEDFFLSSVVVLS